MDEAMVYQIVAKVLQAAADGDIGREVYLEKKKELVPVEVSARHVHLSPEDAALLFGPGHTLTPKRGLSQPGQFLSEERLTILTEKGEFRNVAILGPVRKKTQVELSAGDARSLGISAPLRQSGDTDGAGRVFLLSGLAVLEAKEAVIVAQNHIHMTPEDAQAYGVFDGQRVRVRMETKRPVTFDDVVIRVDESFGLTMHIDSEEANACAFETGGSGRIIL